MIMLYCVYTVLWCLCESYSIGVHVQFISAPFSSRTADIFFFLFLTTDRHHGHHHQLHRYYRLAFSARAPTASDKVRP